MHSAVNAASAALRTASAATNHTPVVYYTGDWLRHDMTRFGDPAQIGIDIFRNITAAFSAAFAPGTSVVHHPAVPVSLGNEDFIPDYHFNVSNAGNVPFMREMADALLHAGIFTNAS